MTNIYSLKESLERKLVESQDKVHEIPYFENYYSAHAPDQCTHALHPHNTKKNLGFLIGLPFDHNLVTSIDRYINASPMNFSHLYLACQGTLKETLGDFWEMIWHEKSQLIMTLSNLTEDYEGRPQRKFTQFWPELPTEAQYGNHLIHLEKEEILMQWKGERQEMIVLRTMSVKREKETRQVKQLHMVNWPDGSVIHPNSLYHLLKIADQHSGRSPIVVHCMGGIGRTGTFIAAHSLYHDMRKCLTHPEQMSSFNVFERILEMRRLRYGAIVAEAEQYRLVINTLKEALQEITQ